jgi:hypothetical protein
VQPNVEPVVHINFTQVRKPLKRYIIEGVDVAIKDESLVLES